jgi:hypothetical protein
MYDVASVDSDTQITLSVNYAGVTASGVVYAIGTGFTVPDSFPEMSQGDIETATIFTRAMRKIQGKFSSILTGGASANFTAMPQVGGDPIVESGSNVDGDWTRWSDGTQICKTETSLSPTYGSFRYEMTYPVNFSNLTSNFRVAAGSEDQGSSFTRRYDISSVATSSTSLLIAYLGVGSISFPIRYMIIGRWK